MNDHSVNNDFIWRGYIEDLSLCDKLMEFHNTSVSVPGTIRGFGDKLVDKTKKDSHDVYLDPSSQLCDLYVDQLFKLASEYVNKFKYAGITDKWGLRELINIQKYDPMGGYFALHSERTTGRHPISARHLVFMTYLNDVTDGGQTEFYYQNTLVEPKKGLTLIWPSDWTHTHRGIVSPTQTKYIATGWFSFV